MHHFKAKGGTVFNFNSDLSGDVQVHREPGPYNPEVGGDSLVDVDGVTHIPGADLLEFVDWWRREYGDAPSLEALQRQEAAARVNAERNAFVREAAMRLWVAQDRPARDCWEQALDLWQRKPEGL